jgi:tetratricopeptide (TPR) repeat protein
LATEAIAWFEIAARLNPHDPYSLLRHGMCLDWLGRTGESLPYFTQSLKLDPNGYYIVAHMGWHYMQAGNYLEAKKWFERSLQIFDNFNNRNPMPVAYLDIIVRRQADPGPQPGLKLPNRDNAIDISP